MEQDIFVLMESAYRVVGGRPIVMLFSRDYHDKYKTYIHEFSYHRPYFYAPASQFIEDPLIVEYDENSEIDALGREVRKVYTKLPSDVPKVRDLFEFTDMSDLLYEKRFLVDSGIKYAYTINDGKPVSIEVDTLLLPRIVELDIEVLAPEGVMPLPQDPQYPIVSIQVMDSYTKDIIIFTFKVPQQDDDDHIACKDESELFKLFMTYLEHIDPDVITAWNSSLFDLPYLIRRSWEINADVKHLGRYGKIRCEYNPEVGSFTTRITGRSTLDMLPAFKKFTSGGGQLESYALKSVISNEDILKENAFSYTDYGASLNKLFDAKDWSTFLQYCRNDVIALNTIDESINLFAFYESIRSISGCRLDDVLYNSKIIEMLLLHEGIKPMPRKGKYVSKDDNEDKFKGAHVVEPKPGISSMMGTFDVSSLYPSILIAFSKSPDVDNTVLKTLEKTMAMREDLRAQCKRDPDNIMLENKQLAVKFLNNSYYGVLGLQSFRLYNREIAEFVTRTGRTINEFMRDFATSQGYEVIFGDSVGKDTVVQVYDAFYGTHYTITMEELFDISNNVVIRNNKEYKRCDRLLVKTVNDEKCIVYRPIKYIVRHKVNKRIYNVKTKKDSIIVTEDHSLIDIDLNCIKPTCAKYVVKEGPVSLIKKRCGVEEIFDYHDYVYDIEVDEYHRFFANNILVHNTDSIGVISLKDVESGKILESQLNDALAKWSDDHGCTLHFTLKFEKLFRRIMFKSDEKGKGVKKKYCGHIIWEEGRTKNELSYKGLELKRSDQADITRDCLRYFLEQCLIHDNPDNAVTYVKDIYNRVKTGDIDIIMISLPKAIRKVKYGTDNPWINGINYAKSTYGYILADGAKPRLIYLKYGSTICIDEDFDTSLIRDKIDFIVMADKTIKKKLESYIWSIGYTWDSVVHGQKSLSSFF